MLRPLVSQHHNVRDALARSRTGDIDAFENVLSLTEQAVKEGLMAYEAEHNNPTTDTPTAPGPTSTEPAESLDPYESSLATVARCKRPYWVCQPYVRPLPKEALEKGSMSLSKKEKRRLEMEAEEAKRVGLQPGGRVETETVAADGGAAGEQKTETVEVPKDGLVCG
jgi:tRNA-dihydrouridine synthase 1